MMFKKKYYHIKNSIKYYFKEDLNSEEIKKCKSLVDGGYMSKNTYCNILERENKIYKVGDIVELIYRGVLGTGEIIKIQKGFFGKEYLIKATVTSTYFMKYEMTRDEVIIVSEDNIIRILRRQ